MITGEHGTLALIQGELTEAAERYQESLAIFRSLNEPGYEAVFLHQLGMVYQEEEQWEEAEQVYREAARLKEELGLLEGDNGADASWQQLAQVCNVTGRVREAEQWYRKALAVRRVADDQLGLARTLSNLADLLADNPACLAEARYLAEESLTIFKTLDSVESQLWITYDLMAYIAARQGESSQAAAYRTKSRQAYFAFPAWRQQLYQHEPLIANVVQGINVEAALAPYDEAWTNLESSHPANPQRRAE
ncbi:hypothetical protein GKODMF_04710 [Candidatus Electrothrix gigas]